MVLNSRDQRLKEAEEQGKFMKHQMLKTKETPNFENLLGRHSKDETDCLEIVGHCPTCGAPIYGKKTMAICDSKPPNIKFSCDCQVIMNFPFHRTKENTND